jgi:hypothetical protein
VTLFHKWLESWIETQEYDIIWSDLELAFIGYFQNPNAIVTWQDQIRSLRIDNSGVQRYTDQFVRLANRLRWSLDGEIVIYKYKRGLSTWMLDSLISAEAAAIVTGVGMPDVIVLGQMALRIEANRRDRGKSFQQSGKIQPKCYTCGAKRHKSSDCPDYNKREKQVPKIEKNSANLDKPKNDQTPKEEK